MSRSTGKKFLSDLKLYSDYLKWKPELNRYETWDEACEDIIEGHRKKFEGIDLEEELQSALESMKEMRVLASQRSLQFRGESLKKHNMRIFNCCTIHVCRPRAFQEIFYMGLCGCGVGCSLLKPFVNNLPEFKLRTNGTKTYIIEDSIEGWADSIGVLLSSYFVKDQPFPEFAGYEIKFDYSKIREKGSFISGGFRAPGPSELKTSLEQIEKLINNWINTQGSKIRPILVFDIICHMADSILSGGVRRSAFSMIVDCIDEEMINAKTGNWRQNYPQRARSNNSVLIPRVSEDRSFFDSIVSINDGDNDIGFAFSNNYFEIFNPCFEVGMTPVNTTERLELIPYEEIEEWTRKNIHLFGAQQCNLNEINAEKCLTKDQFLRACRDGAILGTIQASYTDFSYMTPMTKEISDREALLGVSITGWMNNPKIFDPKWLREGVEVIRSVNCSVAKKIGIRIAARFTVSKPSGNSAVVLGTPSGICPEHAIRYFRIMQLNKESDISKWLEQNMPFLLEDSVWSSSKTDYVVFIPVTNPSGGLFKSDMKGVKHLEFIKLAQENWVLPGTNPDAAICKTTTNNISNTVIVDDKNAIVDYIWQNRNVFTAVSFISDYGDKDFNQAPFTSVLSHEEIIEQYGPGALFASGLIVDGLHYFNQNLWQACDCVKDKTIPVGGTREEALLRKSWIDRAKKFARNYFKGDLTKMVYCLKDTHLRHKWDLISRNMKDVDFSKILTKPEYKDVSEFGAMACSGKDGCSLSRI